MGLITSNDFPNLRELYYGQLRHLLSAEKQITKGLPKMIDEAQEPRLKQAFQSHLQETEAHATRLEELIRNLEREVDAKKDAVLSELVSSGESTVKETNPGAIRDTALIASAQKIEHYEIAAYGTVRDWAGQLGLTQHASVLQKTLDEEKHADRLLTEIAHGTNVSARTAA